MSLMRVPVGKDIPNDFNVIIEIPMRGEPIKYEVDKESGALFVDRFMTTTMYYPCNYGYIPHTLSEDGDPVDVLVVTPIPVQPGVVIRCRPIGMLRMEDEAGIDAKVLAMPHPKVCGLYNEIESYLDIPDWRLAPISHFFEHYKDLDAGKWVRVDGWVGVEEAKQEILAGVKRYKKSKVKPEF
ncbi:MAG: inorganic pyrophosphatase [Methylophilales bacterium RIFCSPHIGHO2_02_FULL_57_10]|nr:MAG: inorganic pyrophosphatase [Methylophilales bacterium RIFCSPHIGHO2_02_FULL_57_10]